MDALAAEPTLATVVDDEFTRYLRHLASRVDRAVRCLPREKTWVKPFPFGNSIGHLLLHLTGNLNHFIGSLVAGTGYVRDRPQEFTDPRHEPAEAILARFHEAVELTVKTIQEQDASRLMMPAPAQMPVETRFGLFLICIAHLNNHIGQMSYLVQAQAQGHSTEEPPSW
ncbi:DinB family protein [Singulisphaera sp. Ch08]|uniref:DinB family protein n=1 Tax=Singulisphaera sp. Ch08 TaxID=3120278 RepID=A0AAU7CRU4_9BACT